MNLPNTIAATVFTIMVLAPFVGQADRSVSGLGRESALVNQGTGSAEQELKQEVRQETQQETKQRPEKSVPAESLVLAVHHPESVNLGDAQHSSPPDFSSYDSTLQKKSAFYDFLLPLVHKANEEVILERQWLTAMAVRLVEGKSLSLTQLDGLSHYEKRYLVRKVSDQTAKRVQVLLRRVDVVPASLILAQAAKESGWGTSRFATEGNNFFGIWCFYQGCGLTPKRRDSGRNHEVATFTSVEQGVRYYVRTINTHVAYDGLRHMRAAARQDPESVSSALPGIDPGINPGIDLANGLIRYSERGMAYVREVQSMIRVNNMQRFNKPYSA